MNLRKEKLVFLITIAIGITLYLFTESDYTVFIIFACLIYGIFAFICSRVTGRKLDISLDISHCEHNPAISVKIKNRSLLPVLGARVTLAAVNLMTEEAEDTAVSFRQALIRRKRFKFSLPSSGAAASRSAPVLSLYQTPWKSLKRIELTGLRPNIMRFRQ